MSPGEPGSRRHKRWVNSLIGDIQDELVPMEEFVPEFRSYFAELFTVAGRMAFEPFVDVTEAKQAELLRSIRASVRAATAARERSAKAQDPVESCYKRIDRRIRLALKKYTGQYLATLECAILEYVSTGQVTSVDLEVPFTATEGALVIAFDDAYYRMLGHAVCQFHSLACHTRDLPHDKRVLVVLRPSLRHAHSTGRLTDLLQQHQQPAQQQRRGYRLSDSTMTAESEQGLSSAVAS